MFFSGLGHFDDFLGDAIRCVDFWTSFWRRTERCRRPVSYGHWCVLWMLGL